MMSVPAVIVVMLVIPFLLGMYPVSLMPVKYRSYGMVFATGYLAVFTVFQCCYLYFILFDNRFNRLVVTFTTILLTLSLLSAYFGRKCLKQSSGNAGLKFVRNYYLWIPVFTLILFQMIMICIRQVTDGDDIYYVSTAVNTVRYSTMYIQDAYTGQPTAPDYRHALSSLPILAAYFSKVTGVAPSVLVHSIFPCILLAVIYAVYTAEGRALFAEGIHSSKNGTLKENIFDNRSTPQEMKHFPGESSFVTVDRPFNKEQDMRVAVFLGIVVLLGLFGNVSLFTPETFMITRTWQGKAVLAALLLPASLLPGLWLSKEENGLYVWLFTAILLTSGCSASAMGMFLIPLLLGAGVLVAAVTRKKLMWLLLFLVCLVPDLLQIVIYLIKH